MKTFSATVAVALAAVVAFGYAETDGARLAGLPEVAAWGDGGERALRVDAEAGEVVALAEFCGIDATAPVEFPIVGELSDRGYEALFRSFARPGAIAEALERLGLPRGRNADSATADFWPHGERVAIDVAPLAGTNAAWTPIQRYVIDLSTRAPLAFDSFVFCGSADDAEAPGSRVCDTSAPNSVLSSYNEAQTVLDMPAHLNQGDVYGRFVLSPDHDLSTNALYRLRFRPAPRRDGRPRARDCGITATRGADGVEFTLSENGGARRSLAGADELAAAVHAMAAEGFDVFASVAFDEALTLAEAAVAARAIAAAEGDDGLRAKGPGDGDIYYKGFLPDETWRVRRDRPSQPWEMRLAWNEGGVAAATLVKTFEDWTSTDSLDPILTTKKFPAATPAEAAAVVASEGDGLPVLLVFAPATMPLAQAMPFIRPLLPSHRTVYIFAEEAAR